MKIKTSISLSLILAIFFISLNSCKKDKENPIAIGKAYLGGIIAYVDETGQHGLIAAPLDQGLAAWGCQGTVINGAYGVFIGTGAQNTKDILAGCNTAGIAAKICDDLILGGYNDWYLPSIDELEQLYINRETIGGFVAEDHYWSSTQSNVNYASYYNFYSSVPDLHNKGGDLLVRAVRSF